MCPLPLLLQEVGVDEVANIVLGKGALEKQKQCIFPLSVTLFNFPPTLCLSMHSSRNPLTSSILREAPAILPLNGGMWLHPQINY